MESNKPISVPKCSYYFYSDEGLAGEFNASGQVIKTYGFAPNSTWTTDPVFMKQGNNYYFYHNDHLGTPQKMTALNGAVVWSAKYESFGKATVDAGSTVENNLRFPGQYYDAETGEHYNWNRYYDYVTGNYITVDPLGIDQDINSYRYTYNNPNSYGDSTGLKCWTVYETYYFEKTNSKKEHIGPWKEIIGWSPGIIPGIDILPEDLPYIKLKERAKQVMYWYREIHYKLELCMEFCPTKIYTKTEHSYTGKGNWVIEEVWTQTALFMQILSEVGGEKNIWISDWTRTL